MHAPCSQHRLLLGVALVLAFAVALAACSTEATHAPPEPPAEEDCGVAGDEDGNGAADCADPACAGAAACQVRCGNGRLEAREGCDDGNGMDGDGCDTNCAATGCGNGVPTAGEACDDGNGDDGDGCDTNCTATGCGNGIPTPGEACDDGNGDDGDGCESNCTPTPATGATYFKASNTGASDSFGFNIALSADGSTLAVSANGEDSAAAGINGDQANDSAANAGAVYVFVRSGATWTQQAYIKVSNPNANDRFGESLALSADGSTLVVGAWQEDSAATGIDGNQADNSTANAGAVYVFVRSGITWTQQAYIKASNTGTSDEFGISVALSGDGSTLAVGAKGEASAATGINGNALDDSKPSSGAVYVYVRSGTMWSQQAYVKASNTGTDDAFGARVALSGDGATLAVSAWTEDSAARGINGNQLDDGASQSGAVYVYQRSGTIWSQQAYVKASNTGIWDFFGASVALSGDGSTLAVSSGHEDSAATGVNGDQVNNSVMESGAAYLFTRSGTTWSQQAYIKASNTGMYDYFGYSLALSSDGSTLAVGAYGEASAALGIGGNQADNNAFQAGAVYVLTRSGNTWTQRDYVKATNTGAWDAFGASVAVSADGLFVAASAVSEASGAIGIGGDQSSNTTENSGAVYVYR